MQDGWYDDNDYDDFDIAEHQRNEDPMSEWTEQASVPVTIPTTPEEIVKSANRGATDAATVACIQQAIEEAEKRGYVKGLFAALDSTSDNETAPGCRASIRCMIGMTPSPATALILTAGAQTSPAKGERP